MIYWVCLYLIQSEGKKHVIIFLKTTEKAGRPWNLHHCQPSKRSCPLDNDLVILVNTLIGTMKWPDSHPGGIHLPCGQRPQCFQGSPDTH